MDSVLYNQDLFRYVCSYMNDSDMLYMTQINKEINTLAKIKAKTQFFILTRLCKKLFTS